MNQFSTYQRFFSPDEAAPILEVLKEQQIPFSFIELRNTADAVIVGMAPDDKYELKIPQQEFERVDELLLDSFAINLEDLEEDHYLHSFTETELKNILYQPDEWGKQDYRLARKLLQNKGICYTDEQLASIRKKRTEELAEPEKAGMSWIYTGYLFALLGGFLGILIGLSVRQSVKTLPDGRKVYSYSQNARRHASRIIWIAALVFIMFISLRLGNTYRYFMDMFSIY